jgi:hypothetical protein
MKGIAMVAVAMLGASLVLSGALAPAAAAGASRMFSAGFWGDGQRWGTVVAPALLPTTAPEHSFDKFLIVTNSNTAGGQAPVVEAAPGNTEYNGGRWVTHTVTWTAAGFAFHGTVPLLMSYADVMFHAGLGHLTVARGSPAGGPPQYFECPLVPFAG